MGSFALEEETSGSVSLLERPEEKHQDGDSDRFAHYVRKDRFTESLLTGRRVVALCGKVWVPTRNPDGYPICPVCKEISSSLDNLGNVWPFGTGTPQ